MKVKSKYQILVGSLWSYKLLITMHFIIKHKLQKMRTIGYNAIKRQGCDSHGHKDKSGLH